MTTKKPAAVKAAKPTAKKPAAKKPVASIKAPAVAKKAASKPVSKKATAAKAPAKPTAPKKPATKKATKVAVAPFTLSSDDIAKLAKALGDVQGRTESMGGRLTKAQKEVLVAEAKRLGVKPTQLAAAIVIAYLAKLG